MKAIIWTKQNCENCERAKSFLKFKGIEYEERTIGDGYTKEDLLGAVPHTTVLPQIFIDGEHVGSLTALMQKLSEVTS